MNTLERVKLYDEAIRKWGSYAQLDMVIEECAELIKAVNKVKRKMNDDTIYELCGEVADVEIMCEQVRCLFGKIGLVDHIKDDKLNRLKDRLQQ